MADDKEERDSLSPTQRKILREVQALNGGRGVTAELLTRIKNPGKGRKADYEGSRSHAIDLNCYSCIGSKSDVKDCRSTGCPFWTFRPGAVSTTRPPGAVPTLSQYQELLDAKTTDAQRATARANAERLRKPRGEAPAADDEGGDDGED